MEGWKVQIRPLNARVDLYLQALPGGGVRVHALDHPGFFLTASSEERALREAPAALWKFGQWLRNHGERPPFRGGLPQVRIAERVAAPAGFPAGYGPALFGPERQAPSRERVALFRERLAWTEGDLVALVRGLPEELLRRPARPGGPAPAEILARMARVEEAYLRCMPLAVEGASSSEDPLEQVLATRRRALAALDRFPEEAWGRVFVASVAPPDGLPEEEWSLAKLLRRMLEHQREQTAHLRRLL